MHSTIFENVKNDRQFSASTGLSKVEFYELLYAYEEVEGQRTSWQQNTKGADLTLATSELRLFFVLYYLKTYPSYDVLGLAFNLDGSSCERNIKAIYPIVREALAQEKMLPIRELSQVEELQEALEDKKILVDATERAIQRASNQDKQKEYYSGKKKHHTVKNTVLVTPAKFIFFLGKTVAGGKYHDFTLLQKDFPTEQDWFKYLELWVDLGYLGIDKKYKIEQLHIPHKKPRKSKQNPTASLREEEKLANKVMSQFRVVVENAIAGIKRYGILVQKLRTQSEAFADDVIELCAGLWNFKLSFKNSK